MGVVSRGATLAPTCDQGSVDTRVDHYMTWIRTEVPEVCVGGEECAGGALPEGFGAEISGGCAVGGGAGGGAGALVVLAALAIARRRRLRARAIE